MNGCNLEGFPLSPLYGNGDILSNPLAWNSEIECWTIGRMDLVLSSVGIEIGGGRIYQYSGNGFFESVIESLFRHKLRSVIGRLSNTRFFRLNWFYWCNISRRRFREEGTVRSRFFLVIIIEVGSGSLRRLDFITVRSKESRVIKYSGKKECRDQNGYQGCRDDRFSRAFHRAERLWNNKRNLPLYPFFKKSNEIEDDCSGKNVNESGWDWIYCPVFFRCRFFPGRSENWFLVFFQKVYNYLHNNTNSKIIGFSSIFYIIRYE